MAAVVVAGPRPGAFDFTRSVVISIGATPHSFHIPQDKLTRTSRHFGTALGPDAAAVPPGAINPALTFANVELRTLHVYANWLDSHVLNADPVLEIGRNDDYWLLIKCAALGHLVDDNDFKDAIADGWYRLTHKVDHDRTRFLPHSLITTALYNSVPEGANFRKLVVDSFATVRIGRLMDAGGPHPFNFYVLMAMIDQDEAMNFSTLIIVRVGAEQHPFVINQDVLTRSSDYFKTTLKECWTPKDESEFRTLTLQHAGLKSFNIYANWLHSRVVYTQAKDTSKNSESYVLLSRCYALGDLLLDVDFKDTITDAFVCQVNTVLDGVRFFPNNVAKKYLYANTASTAKIRQWCVDLFAGCKNASLLYDEDPPEFLRAVAVALIAGSSIHHKAMFADCKYHEHGDGEDACYRKRLFSGPAKAADVPK
ncbi:hypothetical protein B0A48_18105 [Cryoendolithus antarcticus]|uniref:BTB domain-containing protein n=1 Tax=Cryoendolithus antarcticus TaxID=1507870 RepID=A0A1V8SA58_9PEZI|nr:hypothetical protein B0A48_18105 [Cryoendolithus antarcticus]